MHPEAWTANEDYLAWLAKVGWIDGYTKGCDDYTSGCSGMIIACMYEAWKAGYDHRKRKTFAAGFGYGTQQGSL